MVEPADDFVPEFPTVIESELRCRECGYILKGLCYRDACPECGTIIQGLSCSGAYASRLTNAAKATRALWAVLGLCFAIIVVVATSTPVTSNSADPQKQVVAAILERMSAGLLVLAIAGAAGLIFWPAFRKQKSAGFAVLAAIMLSVLARGCIPCN